MRRWSYCIAADIHANLPMGYVLAPTAQEAVRRVGHPDVNVYPLPDDVELPSGTMKLARTSQAL